jgi:hypothetical protein
MILLLQGAYQLRFDPGVFPDIKGIVKDPRQSWCYRDIPKDMNGVKGG